MTTTQQQTVADRIRHLDPCGDSLKWASAYTSPDKAWAECERGDWMLWLIGRVDRFEAWSNERKPFVGFCLDWTKHIKHDHSAIIDASISVLRQWIRGAAS